LIKIIHPELVEELYPEEKPGIEKVFTSPWQIQIKEFTSSNRVGKRKDLFDKYGFDSKFCAHAYRLAKQCVQLMKTGNLDPTLDGHDRDIVMKMRNYEYTKEECLSFLNGNVNEMNEALASSKLPDSPDMDKVNKFVTDVVHNYLFRCYEGQEHLIFDDREFDISNYPIQS
jgi:hypothetical protein